MRVPVQFFQIWKVDSDLSPIKNSQTIVAEVNGLKLYTRLQYATDYGSEITVVGLR